MIRTEIEKIAKIVGRAGALAMLATGCLDREAIPEGPQIDRGQFDHVSPVLLQKCGSLDCHGDTYRNYRLHGYGGRRLDPSHSPDFPATTEAEVGANYNATLGIEPEISTGVAEGDLDAIGDLTLVRKARGAEQHEGGAPFEPDGAAETCLVSWLAGSVDEAACAEADTL